MLITLTGAYRNAGDHLIGDRARALLRKHVDDEILNIARRDINESHYETFNKARAVILCGGPAYQPQIYPKVFPIELDQITTKVVPMGLGFKAKLGQGPSDFKFTEASESFVNQLHSRVEVSSVRDGLTLQLLNQLGHTNVSMTGCPAWYDLEKLNADYQFSSEAKNITFSLPAKPQPDTFDILSRLSKMFPSAQKTIAMHHGWRPAKTSTGNAMFKWHMRVFGFAVSRGWQVASIPDGLEKFKSLYDQTDLHVGYRVHAHIYCLSQGSASFLINEDSRGVGQVTSLGGKMLMAGAGATPVLDAVQHHFDTLGSGVLESTERIKATYPTMVEFLNTL